MRRRLWIKEELFLVSEVFSKVSVLLTIFPNSQPNLANTSLPTVSPCFLLCLGAWSGVTRLSASGLLPQGTKLLFFLGKAPTLLEFSLRPRLPEMDQRDGKVKCRQGLKYLLDVFFSFLAPSLFLHNYFWSLIVLCHCILDVITTEKGQFGQLCFTFIHIDA